MASLSGLVLPPRSMSCQDAVHETQLSPLKAHGDPWRTFIRHSYSDLNSISLTIQPSPTLPDLHPAATPAITLDSPRSCRLDYTACLACASGFVTGWINVVSYLRFNCFGTMCTGNAILCMRSLAKETWLDAAFYLSVIATYGTGVALYRALDFFSRKMTATRMAPAVFVSITCVDVLMATLGQSRWWVLGLALAMGAANTFTLRVGGYCTNAITGNVQKVMIAMVDALMCPQLVTADERHSALVTAGVLFSFLFGVAFGAVLHETGQGVTEETHRGFSYVASTAHFVYPAFFLSVVLWCHDLVHEHEEEEARRMSPVEPSPRSSGGSARLWPVASEVGVATHYHRM